MPFASKYLLIQHFNCLDYIPLNINLSLSWISLLGILGNLVTISLLYKSLCVGCLFINKQFTGVHLWGVLCVELPHLRILGEGPFQRAGLCFCGSSTIWCHYYVCGLTPDSYVSTSIMAISWRSMAARLVHGQLVYQGGPLP